MATGGIKKKNSHENLLDIFKEKDVWLPVFLTSS